MELFGFDLTALQYWHWFALAGVFFGLEVLTAGFFFLWFGVSALFVGALLLVVPALGWELQFVIWAGMAVVDAIVWRIIMKNRAPKSADNDSLLNRRSEQYVGRIFTLEEPITGGEGKIKVDDTYWSASSASDLQVGTKIKVKAVKGSVLEIEPF